MKCYLFFVLFVKNVLFILYTTDCTTAASVLTPYTDSISSKKSSWAKCTSQIYCSGELLHDVQLMHIFKDSKIFVDFKLKYSEETILAKYKELKENESGHVGRNKLKEFVEENFERGNELEAWVPSDWTREPSILERVVDPSFKKWISYLNTMWRVLARRVKEDVVVNPKMYSLMYLPNGFIIPGGRFTEIYYWDTYWIGNGLLLCDMVDTVKGVIENLIHLVKVVGHVPNGSRVYYVTRSQPPLLIQMVDQYYKYTKDWNFVKENIEYLEQEFEYWWDNHLVTVSADGKNYKLARYFSYDMSPRPESYREDYLVGNDFNDTELQNDFYIKIRTAAETGWDFSSRWFVKDKTNKGNLSDIAAPQIVPVDLNSFLHANAEILSVWFNELGDSQKSKDFKTKADFLLEGITKILWNENRGTWFDYDCVNKIQRKYFYASNLTPLFTFSYPSSWDRGTLSDKTINYLRENKIENFFGVPASLDETGEQWDFPNAWAPLISIIVHGLNKLGTDEAQQEAYRIADKWLQSNFKGYKDFLVMYEKYDVLRPGQTGEGGEYIPQTGFGWTNGVVLEFLDIYGMKMESASSDDWIRALPRDRSFRVSNFGFVDIRQRKSISEFYRSQSIFQQSDQESYDSDD